jgi:hypothetical protein
MPKSIPDIRKKRGRPKKNGRGEGVLVRLHKDELARLDGWIEGEGNRLSRPQALRLLMERGVAEPASAAAPKRRPQGKSI